MGFTKILILLFLLSLIISKSCGWGEISIGSRCLHCRHIPNTNINAVEQALFREQCPCKPGFIWSTMRKQCMPIYPQRNTSILAGRPDSNFTEGNLIQMGRSQRILQTTTCNQQGGFILYKNLVYSYNVPVVCHNCRLTPNALTTVSSNACGCYFGFSYLARWGLCYCFRYRYIDPSTGHCKSCASAGPLMAQCNTCTAPFSLNLQGCIYMPALPNGNTNGLCNTGYVIAFPFSGCLCDSNNRYAVDATGACKRCSSTDFPCLNCNFPYTRDGSQCVHGSLIPNYDFSSVAACITGTTIKKNPFDGRTVSCACSFAAQYYQNRQGQCVACSASLPSGVSLADCQSCSNSARFYKGSVQCIYCPGVAYTVAAGTATVNGCDCLPNYFWNALTDKCECDFALGFIGGAISPCISCANIANTDIYPLSNACSCKPGYKWNSQAKTCDCDTSNGLAFSSGGNCVSCGLMAGGIKVGTDGQSCTCIYGYVWSVASKKCQCDFTKNYVVNSKGICADCKEMAYSNGLANSVGCVCINGFIWDSSKKMCACPSGSVVIGRQCTSCSSAILPSIVTLSDCTDCNISKGLASVGMGCFSCPSQTASTGASLGLCTCNSNSIWRPALGACACDWTRYVYTVYTSATTFSCSVCSFASSNHSRCSCFSYDPIHQICTRSSSDPNYVSSLTTFVGSCKPGSYWLETSLPYRCVNGFGAFAGYTSVSTNTNLSCVSTDTACLACDPTEGYLYVSAANQCIRCSTVTSSTGAATINGCVCNANFQWNGATFTCSSGNSCPNGQTFSSSSNNCICDTTKSIVISGTCIPCNTVTNSNGQAADSTSCGCSSPNTWSALTAAGGGACCEANQFALSSTQCFTCASGNGGTGVRSGSGCGCISPYTWSGISRTCIPPTCANGHTFSTSSLSCICDTTRSINVSGTCTPCNNITNSNGQVASSTVCGCTAFNTWSALLAGGGVCCGANQYAQTGNTCYTCTTANGGTGLRSGNSCGCISPLVWSDSSKTCTTIACNPTTQLTLDTGCFSCPNTAPGTGLVVGTDCGCLSPFRWSSSSRTCTCDLSIAYTLNNLCIQCPTNTTGGNGSGGCTCTLLTNRWINNTCRPCSALTNTILINNTCFVCGTAGTNTLAKATNTSCTCVARLIWNPSGFCDCGATSAIIINGNTFSCFTCANATANTLAKTGISTCSCVPNNLTWNSARSLCDCSSTPNAIVFGSGTPGARCIICTPSIYTVGHSADQRSCVCIGRLTWVSAINACGCTSPSTMVIVGTNFNTQCLNCSSIPYATTVASLTACNCIATGMTFSSTLGTCSCPTNNIILPNRSCAACPTGATPFTPYECLCAPGSVWIPAQGCVQCGSSTLPNSLFTGGTNFACACNTGFIWDVMTRGCIANTCTTATASCMRCQSGNAATLVVANARNLAGGAAIQALLAGFFTNYNQIRGFQCTCASTEAWDSLRLGCYPRGFA